MNLNYGCVGPVSVAENLHCKNRDSLSTYGDSLQGLVVGSAPSILYNVCT
jgi:hypothetical protein